MRSMILARVDFPDDGILGTWEYVGILNQDIPEPLYPTIARVSPASREKFTFFKAGSVLPGYV